jgi:hypothetical protein
MKMTREEYIALAIEKFPNMNYDKQLLRMPELLKDIALQLFMHPQKGELDKETRYQLNYLNKKGWTNFK